MYPRRSTVSPDGELLHYNALKPRPPGDWSTFCAVSRLPWVTALAAWKTDGTWTTAFAVRTDGWGEKHGRPFHGACPDRVRFDSRSLPDHYRLTGREDRWQRVVDPRDYVERVLARDIAWGSKTLVLASSSADGHSLVLVHRGHHFDDGAEWPAIEGAVVDYFLRSPDGAVTPLDAMVANWDAHDRLLMADREGWLRIYEVKRGQLESKWEADLNRFTHEDRGPAPEWAKSWKARRPK
jgi:hypothetical protein